MDELPFKLRKNENNTDILLYQIYLPKLHKNIFKWFTVQSAGVVEYALASLQKGENSLTCVLCMTLNNLMVKLQF